MHLLVVNGKPVMDSRDIASLTKKLHANVMRDIRKMQEEVKDAIIFEGIYLDKYGREKPVFKLPYRETIILLSGYSAELRAKVVDRWLYLEKRQKSIRDEAKKTRNQFTEMLKDHGYKERGHYIQTTIQMKEALGITAKKDSMTEIELKKVRAVLTTECYSCSRYHGDLFEERVQETAKSGHVAATCTETVEK